MTEELWIGLDKSTKVLTEKGWKLASEITMEDRVASVDNDNFYTFKNPVNIGTCHFDGDSYELYSLKKQISFIISPNTQIKHLFKGRLGIREIKKIPSENHDYKLFRSAKANTSKYEKLTPFERLQIAFQADGSFYSNSKSSIRFTFSKERKIKRIYGICEECGLEYKSYNLSDGRIEISIKINTSLMNKDFSWVEISKLNYKWCQEFIEEVSYWDATRRSEERIKFDTCTPEVAEIVQLVGISAGYGITYSIFEDNRKEIFKDIHSLSILKNEFLGGQAFYKKEVPYQDLFYRIVLPEDNHLMVRKNRQTMII